MDKYDLEQEARVWQRVAGNPPPAIPAGAIAELARRLRGISHDYARLSRADRRRRSLLRRLANGAARDAERLGAIYYLLTGERTPRETAKPQRPDPAETLRQQYREERRIARDCEAYAQRGGEFTDELREIAADANGRARRLMRSL